jgi:hypothetical protein
VKVEHYGMRWEESLSEAIAAAMTESSVNTYEYLMRTLDYQYGDSLYDLLDSNFFSDEAEAYQNNLDISTMYEELSTAFRELTWIYFKEFYDIINNHLGDYKVAFDNVVVHEHLNSRDPYGDNHDVVLQFEWDLERLSWS